MMMSSSDDTALYPEGTTADGMLTPKIRDDATKVFNEIKNEYYIDKAGPNSERYSKPRITNFSPNLTDEEKQEMRTMMVKALDESTNILRVKFNEKKAIKAKKAKPSGTPKTTPVAAAAAPPPSTSSAAPTDVYGDVPSLPPMGMAPPRTAPMDVYGDVPSLPLMGMAPPRAAPMDAYGDVPSLPPMGMAPMSASTDAYEGAPDVSMSTGLSSNMSGLRLSGSSGWSTSPNISMSGSSSGALVQSSQSKGDGAKGKGLSFAARWERAVKNMVINGMSGDGNDSGNKRYMAYQDLMSVCRDFRAAAAAYGRIILSEATLAEGERTIKTKDIGGIAGGTKYKVSDKILFKSPVVETKTFEYPSYDAAAKVSGHELKCATNLFCTLVAGEIYQGDQQNPITEELEKKIRDSIMVPPLMTLVEYMGYRTVAMVVLPVGEVRSSDEDDGKDADGDVKMECKGCGTQNGECCRHCGMHHCDSRECPDCKVPRQGAPCDVCKRPLLDSSDSIVIEEPVNKTKSTLIYGSSDALENVLWDPEVHEMLGKVNIIFFFFFFHFIILYFHFKFKLFYI